MPMYRAGRESEEGWRNWSEKKLLHHIYQGVQDLLLLCKSNSNAITKQDLQGLEEHMTIRVSEVKAAIAEFKKNNAEALAELGTRIADLNKQIEDLIASNADPAVTDEVFEADLRELGESSKALAEIVPGTPTPPSA